MMSLFTWWPPAYLSATLPIYYGVSQTILIVTAALLFYAAFTDLKNYRIRNEVVGLLVLLFFTHALVSGRWVLLPWNLGLAAVGFGLLCFAYAKRALGGGDVKLLTVALLWTGKDGALTFSILLLAFSMIHLIAIKMKFATTAGADGRPKLPYAPSIAAALIGTFAFGYLSPLAFTIVGPM